MLAVDYRTKHPEITLLPSTTAVSTVKCLRSMFAHHRIPDTVVSDNGPQFSSKDLRVLGKVYGLHHVTCSPLYPQANGEAQQMVKIVKQLLEKAEDLYPALLVYRSMSRSTGYSSSEVLMGRGLKSRIPVLPGTLQLRSRSQQEISKGAAATKEAQQRQYKRHRARFLPDLQPGHGVWIQNAHTEGVMVCCAGRPRLHTVRAAADLLCRKWRFLVRLPCQRQDTSKLPSFLACRGRKPQLLQSSSPQCMITRIQPKCKV